jgi:hypothetical protein
VFPGLKPWAESCCPFGTSLWLAPVASITSGRSPEDSSSYSNEL